MKEAKGNLFPIFDDILQREDKEILLQQNAKAISFKRVQICTIFYEIPLQLLINSHHTLKHKLAHKKRAPLEGGSD